MADIVVTTKSVRPLASPNPRIRDYTAGGTVNIGDAVYLDSTGKVVQAKADAAATSKVIGCAISCGSLGGLSAATGDVVSVLMCGAMNGLASMTPGALIYLSAATAGALATAAPTAGAAVLMGVALTADTLYLEPNVASAQALITNAAAATAAALTDNSGGAATGTLAVVTAPVALTDNTTGVASPTLAAGVGISTIAVSITAAGIATGTIMAITPGYAFKVLSVDAYAEVAISTGAKAATLTPNIAGGAITGGVVALSGTYAVGAKQAGSAVSASNTGTAAQELTLVASAVTPFIEGTFVLLVRIQNMDVANAVAQLAVQNTAQRAADVAIANAEASLAAQVNALITDVGLARTALNSALDALRANGQLVK